MKKQITREEALQKLSEIGHHAHVTVPVRAQQEYESPEGNWVPYEQKIVLNDGIVYDPYSKHNKQIGGSSNDKNALLAMKFIKKEFRIYSSVFSSHSGDYILID